MKRFLILLLVAIAAAMSATAANAPQQKVTGSGVIVEHHIAFADKNAEFANYEEISASRAVKVVVTPDTGGEIVISSDDNLMEYVVVERKGDMLHIGIDNSLTEIVRGNITVNVPMNGNIRMLTASAGAVIVGEAAFTAHDMEISASSAANVEAALKGAKCEIAASSGARVMVATLGGECDIMATSAAKVEFDTRGGECDVEASSGANIILSGTIDKGDFGASSAADIDATELEARDMEVRASSGANIDVWCTGNLEAEATSGADISYRGDCKWKIDKSSGGSVRQKRVSDRR